MVSAGASALAAWPASSRGVAIIKQVQPAGSSMSLIGWNSSARSPIISAWFAPVWIIYRAC